jgi:hypothetical protein
LRSSESREIKDDRIEVGKKKGLRTLQVNMRDIGQGDRRYMLEHTHIRMKHPARTIDSGHNNPTHSKATKLPANLYKQIQYARIPLVKIHDTKISTSTNTTSHSPSQQPPNHSADETAQQQVQL